MTTRLLKDANHLLAASILPVKSGYQNVADPVQIVGHPDKIPVAKFIPVCAPAPPMRLPGQPDESDWVGAALPQLYDGPLRMIGKC
jgi:hypothetical protein